MDTHPFPQPQGTGAGRGDAGSASLAESLRQVHLEMVDAVLCGDGLERVSALAAAATGCGVAIVVPRLACATVAPHGVVEAKRLGALRRYVAAHVLDRPAQVPEEVVAEVPIASGDERLGAVLALSADEASAGRAADVLHLAAVVSLTEVALGEAREEVEQNLRGTLLDDLRTSADPDLEDLARRASRLGCDLSHGAVVLCAELSTSRPRHLLATIRDQYPGALAEDSGERVYALLPGSDRDSSAHVMERARKVAERLRRHGPVGLSSYYPDASGLRRALQEAELVLDVMRDADAPLTEQIGEGTYRLLFRVLASHPDEVRAFYDDTVAPLVAYDEQYRGDLVGTLQSYLEQNCNMNATATAIFAHRHTVAYRLERVRELTGLDPMQSEDRERLGLGLKAYRIIAPRLPR